MASGGNLCNTLFYKNLSKQKKGCFGLRLKAVFIFFVKSIFIASGFAKKGDNLLPFFYGVAYNPPPAICVFTRPKNRDSEFILR